MHVYIIIGSHHIERNYEQRDINIQTSLYHQHHRENLDCVNNSRARSKIQKLEAMQKKEHIKIDMDILDAAVDNFFPPETANFLKAQARLFQQMNKGRRYTPAFKQQCLSLFFPSPKGYRNLLASKLFCMPSPTTLYRFTRNLHLIPGVQSIAFELLKIKIETLEINKYCVICIDEMSLKANLFYNSTRDKVISFEDLELDNINDLHLPACNAAVILIRGIFKSWKQP